MKISKSDFGEFEGKPVDLFTLENGNGVVVKITTYGGTVTSIVVPDAKGGSSDIACGFDTLDGYFADAYKANSPYFGCLVGRYAARVKDGKVTVDGQDYQLATNDGANHIHGGVKGFDKCLWDVVCAVEEADAAVLTLSLDSPDGDEGFPGNLKVEVEYRLNAENELRIHYSATTDKASPVSLTNHTYFNLNGFSDKVLDHTLQLDSDKYLVCDDTGVPLGEEAQVAGTVTDFNEPKRVGDAFEELEMGFEHYYVFKKPVGELAKVATVTEPTSGRTLEVFSSEPGTLFYTGRYTSDELRRESGAQFGQFRAFCVETSKYPNGPNIEGAPNSILKPGETYDDTTVYKFSW
ncbi:aldose epimerase family protein [Pelagicoccus mobilis]|uniref:Aldose 1-epimerase n=1 Tax=Pelagicoccus mobilis TaxID=415221 RepID=A0A934RRW5_9BACT|nr:aldose epimerase family protein [Pelagicoccus mobilis]MBK1875263.1 galactose mutarotase [Pelagicoccus mobilis]